MRAYRYAWGMAALILAPVFASGASAAGSTAASSTVCMSFPVALLLALAPAETVGDLARSFLQRGKK